MSILFLPEEILFKIFYFLPARDLLVIANVNERFYNIMNSVIPQRGLHLHRSQNYNEYKRFLQKHLLASKLSSLNMDGLWYQKLPVQIRNCLNLKVLHVMDVYLSFDQLFKIFTSFLLLEDVEFTWPDDVTEKKVSILKNEETNLLNLKKIKYSTTDLLISLIFIQKKPKLESLTILVTSSIKNDRVTNYNGFRFFDFDMKSLKEFNLLIYKKNLNMFDKCLVMNILENIYKCRLLFKFNMFLDILYTKSTFIALRPCFKMLHGNEISRKFEVLRIISFYHDIDMDEAHDFPYLKELIISCKYVNCINTFVKSSSMPLLNSFHFFSSLGNVVNITSLVENYPNLQKLSFCCSNKLDQPHFKHKEVIAEISKLTSLEHLCIPPCILYEISCNGKDDEDKVQFKKPRMSRMPCFEPEKAEFNSILSNCFNISTLEIATFKMSHSIPHTNLFVGSQSLCNIHKLKNLTRLTLEDIPIYDRFYVSLAEGCRKLEFLRIKNVGKKGKFESKMALTEAIPHFKFLQSFRIDQNFLLPIGELLQSLSECPKLERVFIASLQNEENKLKSEDIYFYILNNIKLSFAWFIFGNVTRVQLKQIRRVVVKDKKAVNLYFQILSSTDDMQEIDKIPIKYMRDMVYYNPWILDSAYEDS